MKAIVKVKFIDKTNGKVRKVGEIITCNKERFAEIVKAGKYVEEYTEQPAEQPEEQPAEQ